VLVALGIVIGVVATSGILVPPQPTPSGVASPTPTPLPTSARPSTPPSTSPPTTSPTGDLPAVPAFPDALGYGRGTRGGRGGQVIYVTSLEDRGPGTLREALETGGPRVVLFQVAGTIDLRSNIDITDPFVTIAGQSAPGEGVQVRGAMIRVMADDVIIRYMRLRPGDENRRENPADVDGISINGANGRVQRVILDHTTLLWGPDIGGISVLGDSRDITVQRSIIGEGLYLSRHPEGVPGSGHSMAANVTQLERDLPFGRRITFVSNLFTSSNERMPRFQGPECVDVVNNVIYDWGERAAYGNPRSLNLVGNLFRAGPDTVGHRFWTSQGSDVAPRLFSNAVWVASNVADGFDVAGTVGDESVFAEDPVCPLSVEPRNAGRLLEPLLADVGASLPARDRVDRRIVNNVLERRGGFRNGTGQAPPNPDWPELAAREVAADADLDGMPDGWEMEAFGTLDRGGSLDSSSDADTDGWTDLEEWLNGTDPNRPDEPAQPLE
jgi:pectate lyase